MPPHYRHSFCDIAHYRLIIPGSHVRSRLSSASRSPVRTVIDRGLPFEKEVIFEAEYLLGVLAAPPLPDTEM